jgi:hypothetical protein
MNRRADMRAPGVIAKQHTALLEVRIGKGFG